MIAKDERLRELLEVLSAAEPVDNGLLAYRLISTALNDIEDKHLGPASWKPPRRFGDGVVSDRLYPSYPDSMFAVAGWPDVTMIVHKRQLVFIGSGGAIQFQRREQSSAPFSERHNLVLFDKADARGRRVWSRAGAMAQESAPALLDPERIR
jgi:hypothetical protein